MCASLVLGFRRWFRVLTLALGFGNLFTLLIDSLTPVNNTPGVFIIMVRFLADVKKHRFLEPNFM